MNSLVYMNHGRWVIDCPNHVNGCTWSYLAMTSEGKPKYLLTCAGSDGARGCGVRIDACWPPLDAALAIEHVLFARPVTANRNWRHPETVDGLTEENKALLVGWTLERLVEEGLPA